MEIQKEPWSDSGVFSLDTQRLFWTPRFIHLDELFIYYFMQSTQNEKKNFNGKSDIEAIWKRYAQLNSVQRFTTESVAKQNSMELLGVNINLVNVSILNDVPSKYYVGLANTTVSEDDALQSLVDPAHKMTIHDKEQLFRMANAAVKEGANFITFPEFFIPIVWLKDLTRFSQKNNVSIIAGLRYIRNANRAFNCTTIIQPCNNKAIRAKHTKTVQIVQCAAIRYVSIEGFQQELFAGVKLNIELLCNTIQNIFLVTKAINLLVRNINANNIKKIQQIGIPQFRRATCKNALMQALKEIKIVVHPFHGQ